MSDSHTVGEYRRSVSRYLHPPHHDVVDVVRRSLTEDLTPLGDLTASLVPPGARATAAIVSRPGGTIAGTACVAETVAQVDRELSLDWMVVEGEQVDARQVLGTIRGSLESILIAERTCLNFLMYLSGIATNTRRYVDAATGSAQVWDTRKTTPGLRSLEKAATRAGGGRNHRGNLSGWLMFKDNHLNHPDPDHRHYNISRGLNTDTKQAVNTLGNHVGRSQVPELEPKHISRGIDGPSRGIGF